MLWPKRAGGTSPATSLPASPTSRLHCHTPLSAPTSSAHRSLHARLAPSAMPPLTYMTLPLSSAHAAW